MIEEQKEFNENEEDMKAENDFLKLKLMAEYGGQFYGGDTDEDVPAEIENQFLSNVIEFEKQFSSRRTITVYEKIGSPRHFKPENEIPGEEIEGEWEHLSQYMREHGVELSACSPRVTPRELYRFTTQELFQHETDDISFPGMITGFIYDEFYPDYEYDNSRTAIDDCIKYIFCKRPFEWVHNFTGVLQFNDHGELRRDQFQNLVNRFKDLHDEIELNDVSVKSSNLSKEDCEIKGMYAANTKVGNDTTQYKGNWRVEFILDEEMGFWQINNVQIEGLAL